MPFQHDEVDKWLRFQSASLNPNFSLLSYFSSANEVYRKRVKKSAAPKAVEQIRVDPTYVPFWAITAKVSVNLEGDDSGQAASTGVETETFLFPGESAVPAIPEERRQGRGEGLPGSVRDPGSRFTGPSSPPRVPPSAPARVRLPCPMPAPS